MKKLKMPKGKILLWIIIGAVAGFFAFHIFGVIAGAIGGWYIGRKVK